MKKFDFEFPFSRIFRSFCAESFVRLQRAEWKFDFHGTRELTQSLRSIFEFVINWNASEFRSRTLNENHAVPPPLLPQLSPLLSNLLATLFSCLFRFSWQLARFYENLLKYQIRSPRSSTIIINNSWNGSGTINKLREIQKSIYLVQSDYIPIVLISILIGLLISLTIVDSTGKKEC